MESGSNDFPETNNISNNGFKATIPVNVKKE